MFTNQAILFLGGAASLVSLVSVTTGLATYLAGHHDSSVHDVNFRRSSMSTTVFSDLADAPSMAPSISMRPSSAPSHVPSLAPSSAPSTTPSRFPSLAPSDIPTITPSSVPSISRMPSQYPSGEPSISQMPTFGLNEDKFRLKMYWQQGKFDCYWGLGMFHCVVLADRIFPLLLSGYFWQEETTERKWCATCCTCDSVNFSETSREEYNCRDSRGCETGDQLYIRNCNDDYGADFRIESYNDGYLVRVDESGNCVERTLDSYLTLQHCDSTNKRQKFQKFSLDQDFELRPVYDRNETCVTQHHHPKDYEVLGLDDCALTRQYTVGNWVAYET